MDKVFYGKYNSHRKPDFQVATFVMSGNDGKYVVKRPQCKKAEKHIETIKENFDLLNKLYKNIEPVKYTAVKNGVRFEFVSGEDILKGIDFGNDDIQLIVSKLSSIMETLLDINDEFKQPFKITDDFKAVFEECSPEEGIPGVSVCNLDCIFSNFIRIFSFPKKNAANDSETDDLYDYSGIKETLTCIDYEWVLRFPVPIDFLRYRMLVYLYNEKAVYLSPRIEIGSFLELFGLAGEACHIYEEMEDKFQQYVHGKNRKYIYLSRYTSPAKTLDGLKDEIDYKTNLITEKDSHIGNLENKVEKLDEELRLKDKHVSNLTEELELNNKHVANLTKELDLKNDHVSNLENLIEDKDKEISHLRDVEHEYYETTKEMIQQVQDRDQQIILLSNKINKIKRCIKNPFFGAYTLFTYGPKKVKRSYEFRKKVRADELERKKKEEKEKQDQLKVKALLAETEGDYESWITTLENTYSKDETFDYNPKISILVPVYNVEDRHLIKCIESVRAQYYKNFELILVDDCSTYKNVRKTLKKYRWKDRKRIKVIFRQENGRISACTNTALEAATGEYVSFLDCDDILRPNALYEVVKKLNEDKTLDFIYSDEDKVDDNGENRHTPFFKPDWSPDTLMSYMYTCHFSTYRTSIAKEIGGLRSEYDGCQDYDFVLRFTEKTDRIAHIDKILYHWLERKESTSINPEAKEYVKDAAKGCKEAALKRRGWEATVEWIPEVYQYRVNYKPSDNPLVSVVIPSKDNPEILRQCLDSFSSITNYKNYEFVVVDNGSSEENKRQYAQIVAEHNGTYIYDKKDFNFSYMCNVGAKAAKGDYILFLNDDIEIIEAEWLERMLGQACLPHVGAVGAKLLYPNTTLIQHAGVINIASGPVHEFAKMDDSINYYFNRNRLDFDCLAVTAACLLVKKDKYNEIEGFDESFAVAYNDIDLCFKLVEKGYYNVIRNDAVLYHHESLSRGDDNMDKQKFRRLMNEQDRLYKKHPQYKGTDPFYNSNLSQLDCDFRNNYEILNEYKVSEVQDLSRFVVDEKLIGGIDIKSCGWCVYIEGWALEKGSLENIDMRVDVILEGENKNYRINTSKVHRKDVAETFHDEIGVEFSGFRCRTGRDEIEDGEYKICVLYQNKLYRTEAVLLK